VSSARLGATSQMSASPPSQRSCISRQSLSRLPGVRPCSAAGAGGGRFRQRRLATDPAPVRRKVAGPLGGYVSRVVSLQVRWTPGRIGLELSDIPPNDAPGVHKECLTREPRYKRLLAEHNLDESSDLDASSCLAYGVGLLRLILHDQGHSRVSPNVPVLLAAASASLPQSPEDGQRKRRSFPGPPTTQRSWPCPTVEPFKLA
jgi:hypothetical protein